MFLIVLYYITTRSDMTSITDNTKHTPSNEKLKKLTLLNPPKAMRQPLPPSSSQAYFLCTRRSWLLQTLSSPASARPIGSVAVNCSARVRHMSESMTAKRVAEATYPTSQIDIACSSATPRPREALRVLKLRLALPLEFMRPRVKNAGPPTSRSHVHPSLPEPCKTKYYCSHTECDGYDVVE